MRIDVITIFPEFFSALDISLVGKARERALLEIAVHDLRAWASDKHRTVDDTPAGGGAGMVMKPDVWGLALDDVAASAPGQPILAIPTPAGTPLTQAAVENLAETAEHLVIACGRYEGIDARVAEHYRAQGWTTFEYSLGDYVLNGGEVAALALIEAVGRLIPGMVGNPTSLAEESHVGDGLLEYGVYTRPTSWRGHDIPEVLLSGNHGAIAHWRRAHALTRTAEVRPDIIARANPEKFTTEDRRTLASLGWLANDRRGVMQAVRYDFAAPADASELAEVAAATFPMACPPEITDRQINTFLETSLSDKQFAHWLAHGEESLVITARGAGGEAGDCAERILGYALVHLPRTGHAREAFSSTTITSSQAPAETPAYLSKLYVLAEWHGSGLGAALLDQVCQALAERGIDHVLLGTNVGNKRARKFYKKTGFRQIGTRNFTVGDHVCVDVVLIKNLS